MKTNWRIWAIAGVIAVGGLTLGTSPAKAQGFSFGFSTGSRRTTAAILPSWYRHPSTWPRPRSIVPQPYVVAPRPYYGGYRPYGGYGYRGGYRGGYGADTEAATVADTEAATVADTDIDRPSGTPSERRRQSLESNGGPVRLARDRPARPALRRFASSTRLRRGPIRRPLPPRRSGGSRGRGPGRSAARGRCPAGAGPWRAGR